MNAPAYTSYSQISTFAECGEKYRLTRIVGVPEQNAYWFAGGSAVHAATEEIDREWYTKDSTVSKQYIDVQVITDHTHVFNKHFDKEMEDWTETEEIRQSRNMGEDWWREHGPGMVTNYYLWLQATGYEIATINDEPAIELPVNGFMSEDNDSPIKGFVDRVYRTPSDSYMVADLKTGARLPNSPLQLGLYRAAILHEYGVDCDTGAYLMVKKDIRETHSSKYLHDLTGYDPAYVARHVTNLRRAIKADAFLPNTNHFCNSCGVREYCWAVNPGKTIKEITSNE